MTRMKMLAAVLLGILLLSSCAPAAPAPTPAETASGLEILFLNVGKADSALVSFGGRHFLIDTGTADSFNRIVRVLRQKNIESLDGVLITHTHGDHTGGLAGVLEAFDVREIYASNISVNQKDGSNIVDEIANSAGREVTRIKAGEEIIPDDAYPQVKFSVLGPLSYFAEDNDNSLVLKLEYGSYSCLFTGDMQFDEERTLLEAGLISECTVLKVGNHGNPDASSHELIAAASPEYAVISTDSTEDTDTPAERVLAELGAVGAQVSVTQQASAGVLVTMNQGGVSVQYVHAQPGDAAQGLAVESLDKESELLVLRNDGSNAIDLGGGWILSGRGGEMFFFAEGTVLLPGKTLSIASGKNPPRADIIWNEKNVWNNKKDDAVLVYDRMGAELLNSSR